MKKDLTKYYAVVEPKDCIRVCNVLNNPLITTDTVRVYIEDGLINLFLSEYNGDFTLSSRELPTRTKISLKTFQNYIMLNKQIDRSFTEPIELRKLTEENTSLINEVHSLNKEKLFLLNEVQQKETSFNHCNDILNKQIDKNEKLKRENYSKSVVIGIISFFLLVALVFITQKL